MTEHVSTGGREKASKGEGAPPDLCACDNLCAVETQHLEAWRDKSPLWWEAKPVHWCD